MRGEKGAIVMYHRGIIVQRAAKYNPPAPRLFHTRGALG